MTKDEIKLVMHWCLPLDSASKKLDELVETFANEHKEAINYSQCCEELPIKEDDTEYWVDLVNWESGGIEEVSNNNLLEFKKDIDVEIQRRLKK